MASAAPKPKPNKGARNDPRSNGKAPKKHPKRNKVQTDPVKIEEKRRRKAELEAERERIRHDKEERTYRAPAKGALTAIQAAHKAAQAKKSTDA